MIEHNRLMHMIGVAEYMKSRAPDYDLDPNTMYTIGLLHDIGYLNGADNHEKYGASILKSIGVNYNICRIISSHGSYINDVLIDFDTDYNKKILILLYEADMSVNISGNNVGFKARLEDIANRHGKNSRAYNISNDNVNSLPNLWKEFNIKPIVVKGV